jgi:hypothetical protein
MSFFISLRMSFFISNLRNVLMRKFFSLSQCFLICTTLLISFKSFAIDTCPPGGITSSTTCTGEITRSGPSAHGIYLNNDDGSTVNMTGDIVTAGENIVVFSRIIGRTSGGVGIYLNNDDGSTVNMIGNITTNDGSLISRSAYGIYLNNANNSTVNMIGNISTSGSNAHGIYLNNVAGSNVNMTGNVTTSGSIAHGIYLNNVTGSNVNMTGNVTTSGLSALGIYLLNVDGSTVITGNVTTSGLIAHGIYLNNILSASDNSNTVNMIGDVTTSGLSAHGIYLDNSSASFSNNNTVNMIGNVSTSGSNALGIFLDNSLSASSNSNTVNMLGDVSTSGSNAHGIYLRNVISASSNSNTVNMTGNITMNGNSSRGIYLDHFSSAINNNNTVNMLGDVSSSGNNAYGIYLNNSISASSNSNTVNMIGNISMNGGDSSRGIYLSNESNASNNTNTVNLTGRISATGLDSNAIYAVNDNATSSNTVQLNRGSSVIGAISGSGSSLANNFLKLNLGAGASYSFATTGFTVQDLNGRPMVSGSAHAAGVGNITTASQSLYERTSQITQSLDDRLRTHDLKQNTSQDFWVNTYYSDSSRGGQGLSGSNLSFNQYRSGITAGFNVKNSYTPTELIVNYEHGKLNIDEGNQGISSNSVMAGALFPDIKKLFTGTLSAKALIGYSDFSGDRKVLTNDIAFNGSRNVTASYQSSHLTIGSAWTKTLYQTDKVILDTLVGIDLNTQHINAYSESDLFKWNGRTINQLQERVTLGMEMKPFVKPLTLFGRVGFERRDLISGENQNYAINNTAVSYNDSNQRNTYRTINAGAYYPLTPTVKAYAQVRYYDSVKDIDALSGSIGISGQF